MASRVLTGFRLAALAAVAALTAACDAGAFSPCTVTCGEGGGCPQGSTCGPDLYCYAAGETLGSCEGGGDGTEGDDGADDGDTGACNPCDPVEQCGCAEADACYIGRDATEPACALAGTRGEEASCASDADCGPGYGCVVEDLLGGHCQKYCSEDAGCGGGLRLCNRTVGSSDTRTCTSDCDPLASTTCGVGEKCTLAAGADGRYDTRCLTTGNFAFLAACEEQYDCGFGLICVAVGTDSAFCEDLCTVGGTECATGGICGGFLEPVLFNGVEYGYCLY